MKNVALAHDQLTQYGGAERVLDTLHEIFPTAPIYTTVYLKDKLPDFYSDLNIKTSFIDKLPIIRDFHKLRSLLFSFGIGQFNLSSYDLVFSDTQGISKGIKVGKNTKHISYVHTVPWAIWGINGRGNFIKRFFGQKWDYRTAQKPDVLIANSITTQERIKTYWKRDSIVINPPVELSKLLAYSKDIKEKEGYIVFVGRLAGYKGELELAHACTGLKQNVIIIGNGKNAATLRNFSPYVKLIEDCSDTDKAIYIKKAKALFNGSVEDFGINMVEAIGLGTPVIALNKGGATEIISDGKTGVFISNTTVNSIKEGICRVQNIIIDLKLQKEIYKKYDKAEFIYKIKGLVKTL